MNLKAALFGCHNGQEWSKWGHFDFSKPGDCIRWHFFFHVERAQRFPRDIRWRLANALSQLVHLLRGGQSYDSGYGMREDRAAHLESNLRFRFIPTPQGMDDDEANEAMDEIAELAQLARATTWVEQ